MLNMKNGINKSQSKNIVTKQDLKKTENIMGNKINSLSFRMNSLEFRMNLLENELKDFKKEFMKFKDQVLKTLDWLVGAFKKFDEEHAVLTGKYSQVNDQISNHEVRITTLEKSSLQ